MTDRNRTTCGLIPQPHSIKQRPAEAGQGRKKNETFYILIEILYRKQSNQE